MKKYNVNVNGTMYEVTVEEVVGGAAPVAAAPAPVAAPVAAPAPAAAPAGGESVTSPMPGNILSVNVHGIRKCLECVKRNSHRQNHIKLRHQCA